MADTRLTEERLRNHLDANQIQRERLACALLPLLGQYSNVEPRRPKGGPDGARDLQATYGEITVWGAVGFRNQASDCPADKTWVNKKFKEDLSAALDENSSLKGFVFFTNIDLTPAEQEDLKSHAKKKGVGHVDLFYRERLRLVLDDVQGWGYRLQYLDIAMSKEEQLAFLGRHGARLEAMLGEQRLELRQKQRQIDQKLCRLEFLHDSNKPVSEASFGVMLDKPCTASELGHFRILLSAMKLGPNEPRPSIFFGARDAYPVWHANGTETPLFGVRTLIWSNAPEETIADGILGGADLGQQIVSSISSTSLGQHGPFRTLDAFDRLVVSIYVTKPLFERIAFIAFEVNKYLLLGAHAEQLATYEQLFGELELPTFGLEWPEDLNEDEAKVEWVKIAAKGPHADLPIDPDIPSFFYARTVPWNFDFSEYTPLRADLENGGANERGRST